MTISGFGDMYDFNGSDGIKSNSAFENSGDDYNPWRYPDEIIIKEGVTSVGDGAFTNWDVTYVSLPESLTYIGESAFAGTYINEIFISKNVRRIGVGAFGHVNHINWNANAVEFADRSNIFNSDENSGHWHSGLAGYDDYGRVSPCIFNGNWRYSNKNTYYYPHDTIGNYCLGATDYHSFTGLSVCPACGEALQEVETTVEIGSNVEDINSVFQNCVFIKSVTIPSTIKEMDGAFVCCTRLQNVSLPEGLTSINGAFKLCNISSINIPDSVKYMSKAFYKTPITEITLPQGVVDISHAFEGCTQLKEIYVPTGCTSLKSVKLPRSVLRMAGAFVNCSSLENIVVPPKVFFITSAFKNCTALKNVLFLEDDIADGNYSGLETCSSLESISFVSDKYHRIISGEYKVLNTFYWNLLQFSNVKFGCFKYSEYHEYCEEDGKPYFLLNGSSVAGYNSISGYTGDDLSWWLNGDGETLSIHGSGSIPDYTVDARPWQANNLDIKNIYLGMDITGIGDYAFAGQKNLKLVTVDDGDPTTGTKLDILASDSDQEPSTSGTDVAGPIAYVGDYAFKDCVSLVQVNLPSSVTYVGEGAFCGCDSMQFVSVPFVGGGKQSAEMPVASSLKKKAAAKSTSHFGYIFGAASASENGLYIPESLYAVVIQSGCTEIAAQAFLNCPSITKIYIPKSVTSIGQYAVGYSVDPDTQQMIVNSKIEIVGYTGSAAEEYANANSLKFTDANLIDTDNTDCACICHSTGFRAFIYKIVRIFWKIFRIKQTCECGAAHY